MEADPVLFNTIDEVETDEDRREYIYGDDPQKVLGRLVRQVHVRTPDRITCPEIRDAIKSDLQRKREKEQDKKSNVSDRINL